MDNRSRRFNFRRRRIAAQAVNGEVLKRIFGGFLLLLSVVQFFSEEITEFLARH